jgi:hypothetical protein
MFVGLEARAAKHGDLTPSIPRDGTILVRVTERFLRTSIADMTGAAPLAGARAETG